jgi:hypothetical protein
MAVELVEKHSSLVAGKKADTLFEKKQMFDGWIRDLANLATQRKFIFICEPLSTSSVRFDSPCCCEISPSISTQLNPAQLNSTQLHRTMCLSIGQRRKDEAYVYQNERRGSCHSYVGSAQA